jgi:hypothetical protein
MPRVKECAACASRQSEIEFLRQLNKDLTDKIVSMAGDSADRYQRFRVAELTARNPPPPPVMSEQESQATEVAYMDAMMKGMVDLAKQEIDR